jgi:hypothetical protein
MHLLLVLAACADPTELPSDDDTMLTATGRGHLSISFDIGAEVVSAMASEAPVGRFNGALFRADDVDLLGPKEGVTALQPIAVEVDLREERPTPPLLTSHDVAPQPVVVLGFLDTDGNADPQHPMPDHGDPCTLPGDNEFDVMPSGATPATVVLGILFYD